MAADEIQAGARIPCRSTNKTCNQRNELVVQYTGKMLFEKKE